MQPIREFVSKDFKAWIWISHILMEAFIGHKISPILMFQLIKSEKKHQHFRFFFYIFLISIILIATPISIFNLFQLQHSIYSISFTLIMALISFIACLKQVKDSHLKFHLLKNILLSSKDVQDKYRYDSQIFISHISNMFNININHDFHNIEKNYNNEIDSKLKK